jgi:3-oxoacyl-[acyl-carrier-protein] synthase-3
MIPDEVFIAATGVHLPDPVPTTTAVHTGLFDAAEAREGGWTGVVVAHDVPAPELAASAGRQAMARSGRHDADVGLLIHAAVTHQGPDMWPAHGYVQRHTVGGHAPALEIRQSCNGMLAGIELAAGVLGAGGRDAALITAADNFGTALVDRYRYASGAGTNRTSILGDAGAAVVLSRHGGVARLLAVNSTSAPELEELYRAGVPLFPPEPTMGRAAALGRRFAHYREHAPDAFAAAKQVMTTTRTALALRTLAQAGVQPGEVTRVTHVFSGGQHYVDSVLAPLGIDGDRGMLALGRRLGHLGACDHIVALDHLLATGQLEVGDHVLMTGNGGTSFGCALIRIEAPPPWVGQDA